MTANAGTLLFVTGQDENVLVRVSKAPEVTVLEIFDKNGGVRWLETMQMEKGEKQQEACDIKKLVPQRELRKFLQENRVPSNLLKMAASQIFADSFEETGREITHDSIGSFEETIVMETSELDDQSQKPTKVMTLDADYIGAESAQGKIEESTDVLHQLPMGDYVKRPNSPEVFLALAPPATEANSEYSTIASDVSKESPDFKPPIAAEVTFVEDVKDIPPVNVDRGAEEDNSGPREISCPEGDPETIPAKWGVKHLCRDHGMDTIDCRRPQAKTPQCPRRRPNKWEVQLAQGTIRALTIIADLVTCTGKFIAQCCLDFITDNCFLRNLLRWN